MKRLFKGLFYSRRRRGGKAAPAGGEEEAVAPTGSEVEAAAPAGCEGEAAPAARGVEMRRRSDIGEVGRSLGVMGLKEMGFVVIREDGEDEVEGDGDDSAAPNFWAAEMAATAGLRLIRSSTRVERGEVVTGEASGVGTRRKKLASRRRQIVESSPPPCEQEMYFETEDVGDRWEQRESSVGSDTWGWAVPPTGYEADEWGNLGMEWGGPMRYEPPAEQPGLDEDVFPAMTAEEKRVRIYSVSSFLTSLQASFS